MAGVAQPESSAGFHATERVVDLLGLSVGIELRNDPGPLAVEVGPDRIIAGTQERGVWSGETLGTASSVLARPAPEQPGQPDVPGHPADRVSGFLLVEVIDNRANVWALTCVAGQRVEFGTGHRHGRGHVADPVQRERMGHGTHHRHAVHDPGVLGDSFAEAQSRNTAGNGAHFALDLGRRQGFRVKGFVLRRRAGQEDEDARLGFAETRRLTAGGGLRFSKTEPVGNIQSQRAQTADLQQVTS